MSDDVLLDDVLQLLNELKREHSLLIDLVEAIFDEVEQVALLNQVLDMDWLLMNERVQYHENHTEELTWRSATNFKKVRLCHCIDKRVHDLEPTKTRDYL